MYGIDKEPWGILLVASGTRSPLGQFEVQRFSGELKRYLDCHTPVVAVYLEFQEPSLHTVIDKIDELGIQNWLCVPLFLFTAGYTLFDSPLYTAKFLLLRRPHLNLRWMPPWGTERQMISVTAGYVYRLLLDFADEDVAIVLVGGGSSSLKTFQKYRHVAKAISRWIGKPVQPSVLAGVGNLVRNVLEDVCRSSASVLFIPYITFDGLLMQNFRESLAEWRCLRKTQVTLADTLFVQPHITRFVYEKIADWYYTQSVPTSYLSGY